MISVGARAPGFELPAYVDGATTHVDVSDALGREIVVLAFYPGDFSPACTDEASDLREFELFTMQEDVAVYAISPDSLYSHRAFAERYDLTLPLLADTERRVAEEYGLDFETEDGQHLVRRAVVIVDHNGEVQYTWTADDVETTPDIEAVNEAVTDIGGDATALGRYRVGHAHYVEARRAFTSGMGRYEDSDWLLAQGDFETAVEEFEEATDRFDSARRFAAAEPFQRLAKAANEKSHGLRRAAEWLAASANAYANGEGTKGDGFREDAQRPLSLVADLPEPPTPEKIEIDADGGAVVEDADVVTKGDLLGIEDGEDYDWRAESEEEDESEDDGPDAIEAAVAEAEREIVAGGEDDETADEEEDVGTQAEDDEEEPPAELDLTDPTEDESAGTDDESDAADESI